MVRPLKKPPDKEKAYDDYVRRYKEYSTSYSTVKASLKSVVKDPITAIKIKKHVSMVNKIIVHTYQFLKMYCIHCFDTYGSMPPIDTVLIMSIMKTLCEEDPRGRKPNKETVQLKTRLKQFYNSEYKTLLANNEILTYTHLNIVLEYEAINMVTVINNHIQNHFYDFFNRYINVITHYKGVTELIQNSNEISNDHRPTVLAYYRKLVRQLKSDLLNGVDMCPGSYNSLKQTLRKKFPELTVGKSVLDAVKKNPTSVLSTMVAMSREIEDNNKTTFGCFPLRKNIVPKYIKIDTATIVYMLFPTKINGRSKEEYLTNGNVVRLRDEIWRVFFNTDRKVFNTHSNKRNKLKSKNSNNYVFNNQISTNGFSCSILKIRDDLYDPFKFTKIKAVKKPKSYRHERYVDEFTEAEKELYKNYNIVGIDPGKDDLIYATNGVVTTFEKERPKPIQLESGRWVPSKNKATEMIRTTKHKLTTFRYSQNQRRKETKSKKYMRILDSDKKDTIVGAKTVKELESDLSVHNSKSCVYANVKAYVKDKNKINSKLFDYYEKDLYRKLNWYGYINRQRSEARMIQNFIRIFGKPEETLICIGDYGQQKQMRYKEPTKGKGIRKIFEKAGFSLGLVYEYNSSAKSFQTGEANEKFRRRENPRPWQKNIKLWHGLLRYKCVPNNESARHVLVNRDYNGSMNIRKRALCHLNNEAIPAYLTR